jgi:hypothetical protein
LIAMIQANGIAVHIIDTKDANKRIDEMANGLIF